MSHVISDECVHCGCCVPFCPVGAIAEGEAHYMIDAAVCVNCGVCEEACPAHAITPAQA